jgi:hypothetical protein
VDLSTTINTMLLIATVAAVTPLLVALAGIGRQNGTMLPEDGAAVAGAAFSRCGRYRRSGTGPPSRTHIAERAGGAALLLVTGLEVQGRHLKRRITYEPLIHGG